MEINFLQVLFQAVNFGVILFVLNKFLYKPIQKVLDERASKINQGLKAAESNLKAEGKLEETKKAELAKARKKSNKIISDAKKEAKITADNMINTAKDEAAREAQSIIKAAKAGAKNAEQEMANSLKELTIATTSKLLSDSLSSKEVKTITDSMLKKLK